MSGGEKKKRGDHSHGWEEAGGEFYQENYAAAAIEADFQQAMQRDPSHIATLLPSKKNRVATMTSKRVKNEPRNTMRRRTATRTRTQNTGRRMSANIQDAQVSMLPDLSENLSTEESTWEEIMQIKGMPISMLQKKELKSQLQNSTKLRLQGFEHLKWQKRKVWQQFKTRIKEGFSKMELWSGSLRNIGGNFGTGIVSYFLFIKWILFLNLLLFLIILILVILPSVLLVAPESEACTPNITSDIFCCFEMYKNGSRAVNNIIDFFHNSNLFEHSLLFYGAYSDGSFSYNEYNIYYDMRLAYIFAISLVFVISLVVIIKSAARGFRERIVEHEGQFYRYCNIVFGGWDYCINNDKACAIKHKALYSELKAFLLSERFKEERQNRTKEEKFKLSLIRIFINALVLFVLCCCGVFLFYVIRISFDQNNLRGVIDIENSNFISMDVISQVLFEFLPYFCIVLLNIFVPNLFGYLITLENYSPFFVVRLTLFRTILLRLSSLAVLLSSFYLKIDVEVQNGECSKAQRPLCWETFVGQQFLKLYVTDIFIQFFITFFINFPRALLAKHSKNKFFKFVGRQEFDLCKHVLDIVYLQTICWLGVFFIPFLPLFAIVGSFLLFYIKKFACLVNCVPSHQVYRANKSTSLFMFILLVCYILIMIPIAYTFIKINPSKACGPLKGFDSTWSFVVIKFYELPPWLQTLITFLGSAKFGVPAFIFISLLLYYYYAVTLANKNMVTVLKNQLVLEGHDKQFLLNRLSAFIKQQQEQNKYQQENVEFA